MRVRVWIQGADGPSRDFELVTAPQVGDRVSITHGGKIEAGVVAEVSWQLQAIDSVGFELDPDPVGTVSLVNVICHQPTAGLQMATAGAEVDLASDVAGSA